MDSSAGPAALRPNIAEVVTDALHHSWRIFAEILRHSASPRRDQRHLKVNGSRVPRPRLMANLHAAAWIHRAAASPLNLDVNGLDDRHHHGQLAICTELGSTPNGHEGSHVGVTVRIKKIPRSPLQTFATASEKACGMKKAMKKMKKLGTLTSIVLWTIAGMAGGDPALMLGNQPPPEDTKRE